MFGASALPSLPSRRPAASSTRDRRCGSADTARAVAWRRSRRPNLAVAGQRFGGARARAHRAVDGGGRRAIVLALDLGGHDEAQTVAVQRAGARARDAGGGLVRLAGAIELGERLVGAAVDPALLGERQANVAFERVRFVHPRHAHLGGVRLVERLLPAPLVQRDQALDVLGRLRLQADGALQVRERRLAQLARQSAPQRLGLLIVGRRQLRQRALIELAEREPERIRDFGRAIAGFPRALELAPRFGRPLEHEIAATERVAARTFGGAAERGDARLELLHARFDRRALFRVSCKGNSAA